MDVNYNKTHWVKLLRLNSCPKKGK